MKQKIVEIYAKGIYVRYACTFISHQVDEIQTTVLALSKRCFTLIKPNSSFPYWQLSCSVFCLRGNAGWYS